ncbi:Myosin 10A, isoform D [Entophlyctis sp. JEL0112]|nr:Myosin 10A, isoform D [Entophlyctis sp. JEL0112]
MESTIPHRLDPALLRSPLFCADALVFPVPLLIDAISEEPPEDAWDHTSTVVTWISDPNQRFTETGPDAHLLRDPSQNKGRGHAVLEVLATERTYMQNLEIILNVIRKELLDSAIINTFTAKTLFAGMENLHSLHTRFLGELEEVCSELNWIPELSSIGRIFLDNISSIEVAYTDYFNNKLLADKEMHRQLLENKEFKQFSEQCKMSPRTEYTELKEFLLRPMQRVTRYLLLLKEILKHTPDYHPDKWPLSQAVDAVQLVVLAGNNKIQENAQITDLFQAMRDTSECPPDIIKGERRCIMSYDATDIRNHTKYTLFLCNDCLLVTTVRKVGIFAPKAAQTYKYDFLRWVDFIDIRDVVDDVSTEILRVTIDLPKPNSQSRPIIERNTYYPIVMEFKLDTTAIGVMQRRTAFVSDFKRHVQSTQALFGMTPGVINAVAASGTV